MTTQATDTRTVPREPVEALARRFRKSADICREVTGRTYDPRARTLDECAAFLEDLLRMEA